MDPLPVKLENIQTEEKKKTLEPRTLPEMLHFTKYLLNILINEKHTNMIIKFQITIHECFVI